MWELILKILEWGPGLLSSVKPPLKVQVVEFSVEDLRRSNPWDPVVVLAPHPLRYRARLDPTNGSNRTAYVRSITLASHQWKVPKEGIFQAPLRLESHEPKTFDVIFPLGNNEEPMKGDFQIEITPSVGRKSVKRVSI